MNVLSLFDGISCARVALAKVNLPISTYYSSEIDKYALKIANTNYPTTIQLGDITNWQTWQLPKLDLIIGGSPCQGFSTSGLMNNFTDPRSKLFFKFVDILNFYTPTYFLLENVKMKAEWRDIISSYLGVEPIYINSSLVSAQVRSRYYWTNIPITALPTDKGILLKDILETEPLDPYYYVDTKYTRGDVIRKYSKTNELIQIDSLYKNNGQAGRVYSTEGKSCTLRGEAGGMGGKTGLYDVSIDAHNPIFRKLTPIECERLQTLPDNYTAGISNLQRYKCLGNAFTVDVIAHILNFIPKEEFNEITKT